MTNVISVIYLYTKAVRIIIFLVLEYLCNRQPAEINLKANKM